MKAEGDKGQYGCFDLKFDDEPTVKSEVEDETNVKIGMEKTSCGAAICIC